MSDPDESEDPTRSRVREDLLWKEEEGTSAILKFERMARGSALIVSDRVKKGDPDPWAKEDRSNLKSGNAIANAKRTKRGDLPQNIDWEGVNNVLLQKPPQGAKSSSWRFLEVLLHRELKAPCGGFWRCSSTGS